jgi:lysophospholipase L1-like esterase
VNYSKKSTPLLLIFISIIVSFVLAETILRLRGFYFVLHPKEVIFGSAPGTIILDAPEPLAPRKGIYLPDKDFFWVKKSYYKELKNALINKPKVVFMGCSCTEHSEYCVGFADIISSKEHKELSFANFGTLGWSSYQGLQQFKRDILRIKPTVITIFYGWNDHWIGFGVEDKEITKILNPWISSSYIQKFRVGQLLIKAYGELIYKDVYDAQKIQPQRVSPEDFEGNLTEIVRLAKKNNIIPVLLTAPTSHVKGKEPKRLQKRFLLNLSDLVPLHRKYINIVRKVAKNENAILCDLAEKFDQLHRKERARKFFTKDGIHFKPRGSQKVALYLYDCFKQNNLLDKILE